MEGCECGGPVGDVEVVMELHLVGDDFIFVFFFAFYFVLLGGARGIEMDRWLGCHHY